MPEEKKATPELFIKSVEKFYVQDQNKEVLDVIFSIRTGKKTLYTARQNFPLGSTSDEIKAELEKFKDTWLADQQRAKDNAEFEKEQAQADETIEELTGEKI